MDEIGIAMAMLLGIAFGGCVVGALALGIVIGMGVADRIAERAARGAVQWAEALPTAQEVILPKMPMPGEEWGMGTWEEEEALLDYWEPEQTRIVLYNPKSSRMDWFPGEGVN